MTKIKFPLLNRKRACDGNEVPIWRVKIFACLAFRLLDTEVISFMPAV